jgi:hypothetical protein
MLTLESKRDRSADYRIPLRQIYPWQVWFDVRPAGGEPFDGTLRWTEVYGYAAPAWDLGLTDWPRTSGDTPAAAKITVYWEWNEVQRPMVLTRKSGASFRGFAGEKINVSDESPDEVTIESVEPRRLTVEAEPGVFRETECLEVRASFPRNRPAWIELDRDLKVEGMEHRFYLEAGKYTGIFWTVTAPNAEELLKSLRLYSVPRFQDAKRTSRVTLQPKPPTNVDTRPPSRLK